MIKEVETSLRNQEVHYGPLTYSDVLKKNLNIKEQGPEVEEILEDWSQYMNEITKILDTPAKGIEQVEDLFKGWRHNLIEKRTNRNEKYENPEDIFESWMYNLREPLSMVIVHNHEVKNVNENKFAPHGNTFKSWTCELMNEKEESGRGEWNPQITSAEEYFAGWRHNFGLKVKEPVPKKIKPDMETIFGDWLYNLQEPVIQRSTRKEKLYKTGEFEKETPTMKRKLSAKQRRLKEYSEEIIENSKEDRRDDFFNGRKIESKKRNQANCRSGKKTN